MRPTYQFVQVSGIDLRNTRMSRETYICDEKGNVIPAKGAFAKSETHKETQPKSDRSKYREENKKANGLITQSHD